MANNISSKFPGFAIEYIPPIFTKLGEIAAKIGYYNFEWRFVTLVMFNIQPLFVVDAFLGKYNQSVILKKGNHLPARRVPLSQFVLFGEQSSEISETLKWLIESMYDGAGKFVIICATTADQQCDEKEIFQTLSSIHIPNAVFLKGDVENNPRLYSYHFMQPEKCSNHEPHEININCNNDHSICFQSIFREQLTNFYKCPLTVSTFEQPPFMLLNNFTENPSGSDGEVLKLLADILNATLTIKTPAEGPEWGSYDNCNWTGSLGDVYNKRAHASMCSIPLTPDMYGNFQISITYNTMDIVWSAKLPLLKPAWEKLLRPLKFYPRLILTFMFVIIILFNVFTKTNVWTNIVKVINSDEPSKVNLFFYSWILFLGMPILRMPSKRNFIAVVYIWIWFSFIIRSCYLAALKDSLKHSIYDKKFTSISDVMHAKYPFGGVESLKAYYSEDSEIYDDWISLNFSNIFDTLEEITLGRTNFVLAFNKEVIVEYLKQFNGSRQLQIIPEKIVNSPSVLYFAKFSALSKPVSRILSMCIEGGFLDRVYNWHGNFHQSGSHDNQYEPMNLKYFAGTIGLLILGWILSVIFFVVEVYCGGLNENY